MSIQEIIKEAEESGFKDKLVEWEADFKVYNPSLTEIKRYVDRGYNVPNLGNFPLKMKEFSNHE